MDLQGQVRKQLFDEMTTNVRHFVEKESGVFWPITFNGSGYHQKICPAAIQTASIC